MNGVSFIFLHCFNAAKLGKNDKRDVFLAWQPYFNEN